MIDQPAPLDEVSAPDVFDEASFRERVVDAGKPVVLRGVARQWPMVQAARQGHDALRACLAGRGHSERVDMFVGDRAIDGRYYYNDDLSGFNFDRVPTTFADAVAAILDGPGQKSDRTVYMGSVPLVGGLASLAEGHRLAGIPSTVPPRLWLGHESQVSCHYDMMDNLACVVAGERRFTLYPPDTIGDLYVGPLDHTMAGQPVSLAAAAPPEERHRYPRFEAAQRRALTAVLAPGDGLYMPKLWWHQVQGLSPVNGLINFWWDATASGSDSPHAAMLLAMITLAERPAGERLAWRAFFDHYAFRPERHPLEHLPSDKHGILGPLSQGNYGRIRSAVMQALRMLRT
jgi:hypothetical protein